MSGSRDRDRSRDRNRIRDSGPDDAAGSRRRPDRRQGQKDTGQDIMLYTGRCTDQDADRQTDEQDQIQMTGP
jgi:hypothetical protein